MLNDYVDHIAFEYQQRFAKGANIDEVEILGVFPGGDKPQSPEIGAWYVGRLECRSGASGRSDLGSDYGRLVGELAPEAQTAKNSGVQAVQGYTMADIQLAKQERDSLAEWVQSDKHRGIDTLLGKL
ncbi:MAG: hypothetical protein NTW06_00250 [Candidatus Falkowbacteria bacterium]|nr:hypothetical protein [Candidatus Falkowbacteria bacterium]